MYSPYTNYEYFKTVSEEEIAELDIKTSEMRSLFRKHEIEEACRSFDNDLTHREQLLLTRLDEEHVGEEYAITKCGFLHYCCVKPHSFLEFNTKELIWYINTMRRLDLNDERYFDVFSDIEIMRYVYEASHSDARLDEILIDLYGAGFDLYDKDALEDNDTPHMIRGSIVGHYLDNESNFEIYNQEKCGSGLDVYGLIFTGIYESVKRYGYSYDFKRCVDTIHRFFGSWRMLDVVVKVLEEKLVEHEYDLDDLEHVMDKESGEEPYDEETLRSFMKFVNFDDKFYPSGASFYISAHTKMIVLKLTGILLKQPLQDH